MQSHPLQRYLINKNTCGSLGELKITWENSPYGLVFPLIIQSRVSKFLPVFQCWNIRHRKFLIFLTPIFHICSVYPVRCWQYLHAIYLFVKCYHRGESLNFNNGHPVQSTLVKEDTLGTIISCTYNSKGPYNSGLRWKYHNFNQGLFYEKFRTAQMA